jgi:hypothetical protein
MEERERKNCAWLLAPISQGNDQSAIKIVEVRSFLCHALLECVDVYNYVSNNVAPLFYKKSVANAHSYAMRVYGVKRRLTRHKLPVI